VCQAEDEGRTPWMTIRHRTVEGVTTLVAAHLPLRTTATAEESDKHKAMKERVTANALSAEGPRERSQKVMNGSQPLNVYAARGSVGIK
jgi:hypothetical protein